MSATSAPTADMPKFDPAVPSDANPRKHWQQDTAEIPPICSPHTKPVDLPTDIPATHSQPLSRHSPSQTDSYKYQSSSAQTASPTRQQQHTQTQTQPPPPPSLLSPAFTPPQTPGASTPSLEAAQPGVPVDSSVPEGGCGTKRPRLLEALPEVKCAVRARIPTVIGSEMFLHVYTNNVDNKEHLAIVYGPHIRSKTLDAPIEGETEMDRMTRGAYTGRLRPGRVTSGEAGEGEGEAVDDDDCMSISTLASTATLSEAPASAGPPLVRIHSECYTGETAWSARCDCGEQLEEAARQMSLPANQASGGIIVYLRQEGRGIGLTEKLKAYNLQDLGSDTVEANLLLRHPADARSYGLATAILADLGQQDVRLLTNNPEKIRAVEGPNREVRVIERVAMVPLSWKGKGGFRSKEVEGYLKAKIEKMGHMLDVGSMPL